MIRVMSLTMALLLPMAAFAEDGLKAPGADQPTAAPVAEAAAPATLVPGEAPQAQPAVAEAHRCGMHGGCAGGGKVKWVILTGVAATVITAVAVGVAVGVSRQPGGIQVR